MFALEEVLGLVPLYSELLVALACKPDVVHQFHTNANKFILN